MFQGIVAFIAVVLTYTMFSTRQMMLGFPCAMFWAVLGAHYYSESTVAWDLDYTLFFASMGMVIFSVLAMYGLRTKKQEIEDGDPFFDEVKDDTVYYDEGKNPRVQVAPSMEIAEVGDSMQSGTDEKRFKKSRGVRDRATKRRTRGVKKPVDFGEFK